MTPDGWRRVRLSEVADQRTEKAVPVETDTRPYIALEHLAQGRPALLGWARAGTAASAKTFFRAGDVLFGKLRPYLRKAARAPFDGLCSTDILSLFGRTTLDSCYLAHLAQWDALTRHAVATSSGTKMPRTSWAQLGEFQFSLPPLLEQRKIAAILSSVDDAIEKTQAVIDQMQVVKRGLMQELLTRGLPGRHTRFKRTVIGEMPESWGLVALEKLIKRGPDNGLYRPQSEYGSGTPIVRIEAFGDGDRLRRPCLRRVEIDVSQIEKFAVQPGDILINRVNSVSHLAKSTLVESLDERTVYESNMMRLTLDDSRIVREFGFAWLVSKQAKQFLKTRAKRAVAQASVNQGDVCALPVPCPPRLEQQRIADVIGVLDGRIEAETDELAGHEDLKFALTAALLTGEARVSVGFRRDDREERRRVTPSAQLTAVPTRRHRACMKQS